MFRCVLRPRAKPSIPAKWLPSLASSGSRGIKLYEVSSAALVQQIPKSVSFYPPFTTEGRRHLARLLEHDIGLDQELRPVKRLTWRSISFKVSRRHVASLTDLRYFTENGNGYAEVVARRYLEENDKPLWTIKAVRGGEQSIVRGKAKYRISAALKQALQNAAYDADGQRLSENKLQKLARRPAGAPPPAREDVAQLYGTVEVMCQDSRGVLKMPFSQLVGHFEKFVEHLVEELGQTADGRRASGPSGASGSSRNRRPAGTGADRSFLSHNRGAQGGGNKGRRNEKQF